MARYAWVVAAAGTAVIGFAAAAEAASDITIAAITTGRLYVVGNTERPHTPVTLDGQFRTDSDDRGKFQYELVYYPARCIVSASIEGKTYEAVVSDCGQKAEQCQIDRTKGAPQAKPPSAALAPALGAAPVLAPTFTPAAPGPDATSAVPARTAPPASDLPESGAIRNPPLPPQRPVFRTQARMQTAPAVEVPRGRPAPSRRLDSEDPEPMPED